MNLVMIHVPSDAPHPIQAPHETEYVTTNDFAQQTLVNKTL